MQFTPVTPSEIEAVLTAMAQSLQAELANLPENDLESYWHFKWDDTASLEWNLYKFTSALELFKKACRRWEDAHSDECCVVERVRDKYLMPKIREFTAEMRARVSG